MDRTTEQQAKRRTHKGCGSRRSIAAGILASALALLPQGATADEGGVSFWIPGFFGSLAAVPQQPGWALGTILYNTSVSAGANVALAQQFRTGRVPANFLAASVNANIRADVFMAFAIPTYVFETPVLGGQAAFAAVIGGGRASSTLNGTVTGAVGLPGGIIPFFRSDSITDTVWGNSDLIPMFSLRWNAGVHNYMAYITGDIPIGNYDSARLANTGIGHGAIDVGGGYTYLNPQTGHEFSGVLGFTYNLVNPSTQYQNGVDMHFDWGASQFLSKQLLVGLVGYAYQEIGCDSGSGDRVGCFRSRVFSIGPQLGYIFPLGDKQGYLNLKGYKEFGSENRPEGWNVWLTFVISPAAAPPPPAKRMMVSK